MDNPPEITRLLQAWAQGENVVLEELLPLVYAELHCLAAHYMGREAPGHTLQATALVNEAYLRLLHARDIRWKDRAHFFAVSAQIMRRILVDLARSKRSRKHGGEPHLILDEVAIVSFDRSADFLALDEALERLAALSVRQSQVVELRYFGGLSETEVAEVLKVSERTVRHDWSLARVWLYRELATQRISG